MIRNRLPVAAVLLALACTTSTPTPVAPPPPPQAYGISIDEEAMILRLEDRREYDAKLVDVWVHHANPLHRARIALALGRIGTATFDDANANGVRDAGEPMAGVTQLASLANDPEFGVRRNVAFALGEIGDPAGIDRLLALARDTHADVAAEAVEALSKLASDVGFDRYSEFTRDGREGVRGRAARFLFRFASDPASARAVEMLEDASPDVKREAVYALARRAYAPARAKLELLLTDPDTLTRSFAARGLGRIGDRASRPALLSAIGDPHPWVRTDAGRALTAIAEKNNGDVSSADIESDVRHVIALSEDADPGSAITGVEALGYYAKSSAAAKERIFDLAVNGAGALREEAAAAVTRFFGDDDAGAVRSLLQTDARWIKIRVASATSKLAHNGAAFRSQLAGDADASVRSAAIGAIPDDSVDTELDVITRALDDTDVVVRANAIDRFALTKHDAPADVAKRLLDIESRERGNRDDDARLSAISAISALDVPEREPLLRSLLADGDPIVRRAAADAIEQKLKKPRPQFTPLPIERTLSDYATIAEWARAPHSATIRTNRGDIRLALLAEDAPITAKNFADLATKHFFDNTSFMRVVPNFVIQGGDPRNDMSGGPGYSVRDEINLQKYTRGAVGMANSGPDTNGSQFFITHSPHPHLDGGYTIFGRVTSGMAEVVDQIRRGDVVKSITIDDGVAPASADSEMPLPIEIGSMTREHLLKVVPQYRASETAYQPDTAVVEMLSSAIQPADRVVVYLGTWSDESRREVPKLLKIADVLAADFNTQLPLTFVALNRDMNRPVDLLPAKRVDRLATIVYYRGDVEVGRIVEKPDGLLEDDLLTIVAGRNRHE